MEQHETIPEAQETTEQTDQDQYGAPRGAFVFVLLMLAGYIVYWFSTYLLVVVERGGS